MYKLHNKDIEVAFCAKNIYKCHSAKHVESSAWDHNETFVCEAVQEH